MADEQIVDVPVVTAPEIDNTPVADNADHSTPAPKKSVREHIKEAMNEVKEKTESIPDKIIEPKIEKTGAQIDKLTKNPQKAPLNKTANEIKPIVAAPDSLPGDIKSEWSKLDPKIQSALVKREADIHKGLTTMDEERSFAKEMQKTILPYMPLINMSQSTPAKAVTELLNYAQILQTGTPQSKGQLLHQLAQRWGADMRMTPQAAQQPQNQISAVQQELQRLRDQVAKQPELIKQQQETAQLKAVIDAFSADPKNSHYERVKPVMAALLSSGQAKDMQDAYDKACYADPDIRSTLLAEKQKADEAKRIADIKAKSVTARNASVSVKGSSSLNGAALPQVKRSLREELQHNLRAVTH